MTEHEIFEKPKEDREMKRNGIIPLIYKRLDKIL